MTENLNKRPRKSILKSSSSFDKPSLQGQAGGGSTTSLPPNLGLGSEHHHSSGKCAKFDEMNIIETLHPADKDYGHMKIDEPKTPFSYLEENSEALDADVLTEKINSKCHSPPRAMGLADSDSGGEDDEQGEGDPVEKRVFESKRKAHYNEYYAVKLARKLMEEEEEEDEDDDKEGAGTSGSSKFIPQEEAEIMEET